MMEPNGHLESHRCDEISILIEKEIAEENLTADEKQAIAAHLEACATCSEIVKVTRNLHLLADEPSATELDSAVGNIMDQLRGAQRDEQSAAQVASNISLSGKSRGISKRPVWHLMAAAALVMLAIGGGILFKMARSNTLQHSDKSLSDCTVTNARMIASGVEMVSCGQTGAAVHVADSGEVRLLLKEGAVALHVDPSRERKTPVWVETPSGRVRVKGTVFGVYVNGDESGVEVFRGAVAVYSSVQPTAAFDVGAGQHADFRDTGPLPIDDNPRTRILAKSLQTVSSGDTIVPGKVPMSRVSPSEAGDVVEKMRQDDTAARETHSEPTDSGRRTVTPVRPRTADAAAIAVDELLQRAQLSLIDSDWNGAAGWYQKVLRQYPGSPQAATVRISLARLELRHLGRPARALKHYKAYRKRSPKGPLAEEALFGIAESYRVLGATDNERRALQQFIEQFPGSTLSSRVRKRLQQLSLQSE